MRKQVKFSYVAIYLLGIVFFILIGPLCLILGNVRNYEFIVMIVFLSLGLLIAWMFLVPFLGPYMLKKRGYKKLESSGFKIEKTYKSYLCSWMLDITGKKVAVIYSFNPTNPYIFSASKIETVWINEEVRQSDQRIGRVSVRFIIDGKKESYDTYYQRTKYGQIYLDSNHSRIQMAREQAQSIMNEINRARGVSGK